MLRSVTIALALLAAPVLADSLTVETYAGPKDVVIAPETFVVFDVSALDTLDALGVRAAGTVDNVFVPYLADAVEGLEVVGSLFEPDYEALAAMAPDLIIAGGRSHKAVPDLEKIASTIDMTIWEDTVGQGLSRLEAFGKIFGKEAEAEALKTAFYNKLAEARNAVEGQGKALILMTNGPKVSAYGSSGRFGWLHTALDLPEAVAAVEQATHGEAISFEFIAEANPDILIVIDRMAATGQDGAAAKATLDNELVAGTAAAQTGRIVYLNSAPVYIAGGGIQSMSIILDQFIAVFGET